VPDIAAPTWIDDLFRWPTPSPFARLIDIAWREITTQGFYHWVDMSTHFGFMDLTAVPAAPAGWPAGDDSGEAEDRRQSEPPLWAPPEFETFGKFDNGGYVGWVVAAPELGWPDHPVGQVGPDEPSVFQLGQDTKAGLEFLMSRSLRWWQGYDTWTDQLRDKLVAQVARVAGVLDIHPDPARGVDSDEPIHYDVPAGWRHRNSADGVGVLAPADMFADRDPVIAQNDEIKPVLADAADLLDAGYPASALLGIRETYHHSGGCYLGELAPLWERAYHALGRPQLADVVHKLYWR
jgi:hypothetical protein